MVRFDFALEFVERRNAVSEAERREREESNDRREQREDVLRPGSDGSGNRPVTDYRCWGTIFNVADNLSWALQI